MFFRTHSYLQPGFSKRIEFKRRHEVFPGCERREWNERSRTRWNRWGEHGTSLNKFLTSSAAGSFRECDRPALLWISSSWWLRNHHMLDASTRIDVLNLPGRLKSGSLHPLHHPRSFAGLLHHERASACTRRHRRMGKTEKSTKHPCIHIPKC